MNHKIVDKIVFHKNVHKIGVESCVTSCILMDHFYIFEIVFIILIKTYIF